MYPDAGQRSALARAFGCARVVFNDALRVREDARTAGLPFVTFGELSKRLTASKKTPERAWLGEVSAVILQQSLRDLDTAYRNFFDSLKGKRPKMGAPRFKSLKDNRQAVRFTANAGWKITSGGKLRLPKIGDVTVKWSRSLPCVPSTVSVVKDAAGRGWHTSRSSPTARRSNLPDSFAGPRKNSSGNSAACPARPRAPTTARRPASRSPEHTPVSPTHAASSTTSSPAVNGLARTRLAKSVHDAGWSAFVNMLEYKAARYGRTLVKIGRFEPTSQVCSQCGVKDGPKPLHVREWECKACGAVLDRDVNAAVNVARAAGLAVSACRARVRPGLVPAQREEAGTHSKASRTSGSQAGIAPL